MTSSDDRRRRIRVPVQQAIRHSKYQVLGTPVFEENSAIDLSSNGIAFVTAQEYKKGTLVLLEVVIEQQLLKLLVCVAWIKKSKEADKFEVGAELIAIDPEHKKQMQGHLSSLIQKFSAKTKVAKKKPTNKKKSAKKVAKKKPTKAKKAPVRKKSRKK